MRTGLSWLRILADLVYFLMSRLALQMCLPKTPSG
jgi:hypothetical protein